jgi:hypothetical protein
LRRVAVILAGLVAAWLTGCASPGAQPIVGPDGSPMAHVHCGAQQGVCFRIAGELCPSGYDMKPVLRGDDGNFLVRCRSAIVTSAALTCPLPVAASAPPALMYPWPPPEAGAAAQRATTPTPTTEIDLGY